MERFKGWAYHVGFASLMAGALLSRDACIGGSTRPPPEPPPVQSAEPAKAPPSAAPTSTQTFAAPP